MVNIYTDTVIINEAPAVTGVEFFDVACKYHKNGSITGFLASYNQIKAAFEAGKMVRMIYKDPNDYGSPHEYVGISYLADFEMYEDQGRMIYKVDFFGYGEGASQRGEAEDPDADLSTDYE